MNKKKVIIAALLLAIGVAGFAQFADAQYTPPTFWKRVGTALLPAITGDTIGSSGSRISAVYATLIDGLSIAISGAVTGDLTGPSFIATSTSGGGFRFGTNGNVDIGTPALSAGAIYSSGTIYGASLVSTGSTTSTFAGVVSSTRHVANYGTAALPAFTFSNKNDGIFYTGLAVAIGVGGTQVMKVDNGDMTVTGHIYPASHNGVDIGRSGLAAWKNIYASGTAQVGSVIAQNGTAAAPSLAIANTGGSGGLNGFYNSAPNVIGLVINGTGPYVQFTGASNGASFGINITPDATNLRDIGSAALGFKNVYASGTIYTGGQILAAAGSVGAPSYAFARDPDSGLYSSGGDGNLIFVSNGAQAMLMTAGGILVPTGQVYPLYNNLNNLGLYSNSWKDFYASGTAYIGGQVLAGVGSATTPTFSFLGDTNTGLSQLGNDVMILSAGGGTVLNVQPGIIYSYANLLTDTTNLRDIGSATRSWKDAYVSGTIYGKDIAVSTSTQDITWSLGTGPVTKDTVTGACYRLTVASGLVVPVAITCMN